MWAVQKQPPKTHRRHRTTITFGRLVSVPTSTAMGLLMALSPPTLTTATGAARSAGEYKLNLPAGTSGLQTYATQPAVTAVSGATPVTYPSQVASASYSGQTAALGSQQLPIALWVNNSVNGNFEVSFSAALTAAGAVWSQLPSLVVQYTNSAGTVVNVPIPATDMYGKNCNAAGTSLNSTMTGLTGGGSFNGANGTLVSFYFPFASGGGAVYSLNVQVFSLE